MFNFSPTKNKLFLLFLFLFITILSIYLFKDFYTIETISTQQNNFNNFQYDFDCDGENDELTILSTNSTYSIRIKNSLGETLLKSSANDYSLLDISSSCKINISYIDLNRNKVPEIVISGLKNNKPTFYVFQWLDNSFKEIIFSQNNIFGILDYNNSRTPKVFTTLSTKGDESTSAYIVNANSIKDITFSSPKIPSLGNIQILIDLIEAEYEIDDAPDIFTPYINSKELGLLWNLDKLSNKYAFQKANFYDMSWDENGVPTAIHWTLSFEKVNFTNSSKKPEELVLYVTAEIDEENNYKISSIIKQ